MMMFAFAVALEAGNLNLCDLNVKVVNVPEIASYFIFMLL